MCAKGTIHANTRVREAITIFMKNWYQKEFEEVICINLANNGQVRMILAFFFFFGWGDFCGSNGLQFMLNCIYADSQIDSSNIFKFTR